MNLREAYEDIMKRQEARTYELLANQSLAPVQVDIYFGGIALDRIQFDKHAGSSEFRTLSNQLYNNLLALIEKVETKFGSNKMEATAK